ncbi:MAG: hypothetical protein RX318_00020 [bacterium]|nr:hypothetical protein [bacterium]
MRWIPRILGAILLVALAAQPATAVVITTHWGNSDAPQYATPAAFIEVFFNHSNGKRYRCNTGPYGICDVDMPPGTVVHCQAYQEDTLVASFPCGIPVGEQALAEATAGAKTQTAAEAETPQNPDDPDVVVHYLGKKKYTYTRYRIVTGGAIYTLVKVPGRDPYLITPASAAKLGDDFISMFFPANAGEIGGGGDDGNSGDGNGNGNGD